MLSILSFGLVVGAGHAFEADHIAAVSSLVSGKTGHRSIIRHGMIWGLGHTLILLVVGGTILTLKSTIAPDLALGIEALVGMMLVGLGGHVLYRLRRDRVHFHKHRHGDAGEHFHLHSHAGEGKAHDPASHAHAHPDRGAIRALLVGMMHGLAGSAAVVLGTAAALQSPLAGLAYIAVFGAGSIAGMALVSAALSVPLIITARLLTRANTALQLAIGVVTIGIGIYIVGLSAQLLIA